MLHCVEMTSSVKIEIRKAGTRKIGDRMVQCVAACCSVLQCVAVCCSFLQSLCSCQESYLEICEAESHREKVTGRCSVLKRVAMCCSVLQCVAVCCIYHECHVQILEPETQQGKLITRCCSVLQCVAVRCNIAAIIASVMLRSARPRCNEKRTQDIAVCSSA